MQLKLKSNNLSVHSNLEGGTHGHLRILMTNTKYATLSPVPYVRPMHPGIMQIANNATRVASYKLKRVYDENLQVFHELRRVEQALIQKVVTSVDKQYITSTKNHTTKQFTESIRQIVAYLFSTYRKISSSNLNDLKKEVTDMHYDTVNPVDKNFNNIEYLLEYGEMEKFLYSHPQDISKVYNILNKTGKFRWSINSWNRLPLIQKTWVAFKTDFWEAHLELTKTGESTLEEAGYEEANIVEDIVSRLSVKFQHQENMVNRYPPQYTGPTISGTAELLQQVLDQNQELMWLLSAKYGKSGRKNTSRPPTLSTGPFQGQPFHPMPTYFDKYF